MTESAGVVGTERYRALLRTPHARRLIAWGLVARLPLGMVPLALLLVVRASGGSYAAAGAVSGAYLVAAAIGAPIAGRRVDRSGQARVLLPRAVLNPGLLLAVGGLALADAPTLVLGACAAGAGAVVPPVAASLRSLWPRLLEGPELRATAYALEASLQEVFFLVGPLLVAVVSSAASPAAALALAAAAGGVGTLAFASSAPVRAWRPEAERDVRGLLGALESPGIRTIVLYSGCCGLAFGGSEVAMPAFAEQHGGAALGGVPLAFFAGGSLAGGLVAGARTLGTPRVMLRAATALLAAGLALPLLAGSLHALSALVFVAGLPIAPAFAAAYGLVDAAARRGTAAEAFAWIGTAISAGLAVGTAAGGALVDAAGVRASFALGCAAAAAATLLALGGPGLDDG